MSDTHLFWSKRGEIGCERHAPAEQSTRWVNEGWQQRMRAHMDVMTRYGVLSSQYGIHTV